MAQSAFDADLQQLAYEMERLHALANAATPGNIPPNFATLDRVVSFRLDTLAYILAMQDSPMFPDKTLGDTSKPPAVTRKRD